MSKINILHLSDLHARIGREQDMRLRLKALILDIKEIGIPIDIVVFSGDIAYSGKYDEYNLANKMLFNILKSEAGLSGKPFLFVPGNHDVDRALIDPMSEAGLRTSIKNSSDAEKYLNDKKYSRHRLSGYSKFLKEFNGQTENYYVSNIDIRGLKIGFAHFNSAWRCFDNEDKGNLFLTESQVNRCVEEIQDSAIRIAILHHPFDWLNKCEQGVVVADVKSNFDLILTGHLHENISLGEISTSSECLMISSPAIFDEKNSIGYNIYELDVEESKFKVNYRKFIRERREFDANVDHAKGGVKIFDFKISGRLDLKHSRLTQKIAGISNGFNLALRSKLQQFQHCEDPIFVTPPLYRIEIEGKKQRKKPIKTDFLSEFKGMNVIYGGKECGKSTFLHAVGASATELSSEPVIIKYLDFQRNRSLRVERQFKTAMSDVTIVEDGKFFFGKKLILIDDIFENDETMIEEIIRLQSLNTDIDVVVVMSNDLLFKMLIEKQTEKSINFFSIEPWGPKRIRELSEKYFRNTNIDVSAAFNFIQNSLMESDLPVTPVVVLMYLNVFTTFKESVTSISFIRLLEQYEELRFGSVLDDHKHDLYNKRLVLAHLAAYLQENEIDFCSKSDFYDIIERYFGDKLLDIEVVNYANSLVLSNILVESEDNFGFKAYVFFDYYLAKAFEKNIVDVGESIKSLYSCIRIADALAIYSGLVRENKSVVLKVRDYIVEIIGDVKERRLSDLDGYIDELLMPHLQEDNFDDVVGEAIDHVDDDSDDEIFIEGKKAYKSKRESSSENQNKDNRDGSLGEMLLMMSSLQCLYKIFRNLENIDKDVKLELLEQILNYNIEVEFRFIEFFHRHFSDHDVKNLFAYLSALAAQEFLHSNTANQSLAGAINTTLENTDNDLKQLILLIFYADLRLPGFEKKLENFIYSTESRSAIELIYMKIYHLLIDHRSNVLPTRLIALFRTIFEKRNQMMDKKRPKTVIDRLFESKKQEIEREKRIKLLSETA